MQPVLYALDDRLANAGDTVSYADHIYEASYELGEHTFTLPAGIDFDLVLTNAGEGILVTGMLRADVVGVCDRCLEKAQFSIHAEVDEYYLFEEPTVAADDEDEADYVLVNADKTIDLAEALLPSLVMETPYVVLCRPDCKGLCPVCGTNLNEEDCGHAAQHAQDQKTDKLASNPFAALKNLTFKSDSDV